MINYEVIYNPKKTIFGEEKFILSAWPNKSQ